MRKKIVKSDLWYKNDIYKLRKWFIKVYLGKSFRLIPKLSIFFCFKVFVFGTFSLKERLISYKIKSKLKLYKIKRVGTCMLLI